MEILNPTIPKNSIQISSRVSIFSPKHPLNLRNKNPSRNLNNFSLLIPFLLKFSLSTRRNFKVSAHFGRPTNRRNYLRKKLIEQQKQVRKNPIIYNPIFDSENAVLENDGFSNSDNVENVKLDSVLWNKLESWVDQYKTDSESWGIGTNPIFTVFRNSNGEVEKVAVNEDEILRRCQIEPLVFKRKEVSFKELNLKLSHAKYLAREMESGNNVLPSNSSVAKFVNSGGQSGSFVDPVRGFSLKPGIFRKLSRVGVSIFCGVFMFFIFKRFFAANEDKEEYTSLEKEMLRRKIKSRMEKEKLVKGSVEVIQDSKEPDLVSTTRPLLDKKNLMNSINKVKVLDAKLASQASFITQGSDSRDFDSRIQEIRAMAKHAREIERTDPLPADSSDGEDDQTVDEFSNGKKVIQIGPTPLDDMQCDDTRSSDISKEEVSNDPESKYDSNISDTEEVRRLSETSFSQSKKPVKISVRAKPRIIKSVQEAREYLSQKHDKPRQNQETKVKTLEEDDTNITSNTESGCETTQQLGKNGKQLGKNGKMSELSILSGTSDFTYTTGRNESVEDSSMGKNDTIPVKNHDLEADEVGNGLIDYQLPMTSLDRESSDGTASENKESWMEKNFHEFEPIVKKIGVGFRDNYMVARDKVNEDGDIVSEIIQPESDEDGNELDWMKDEKLSEIVFQVRENELMGRDPFYLMDDDDKLLFFEGLEKKVDKENDKLLNLHQWVHSNIENLDYGADGISLHDSPEKFIPRWKGPPPDTSPEFLNDYEEQRKALFAESLKNSNLVKKDGQESLQKSLEFSSHDKPATTSAVHTQYSELQTGPLKSPKTVIEGSDGSVRPGKKSGKEYWQHTKKWSRGFIESYNAETDPETKAVMKDIGKDLDRWITEKEIQDAADLMNKIPEKGQKFIQEKLNKVKREMELYGPPAVMSKYSEYGEEKEEDYLWWLDLAFVLCIELYVNEDEGQRIGFYSLEMAEDLELEPKPHHVIAFEDAGDCKNLCYIIQAHMEMLGNGNAFVVAQPPKDAFQEAKANGFNVTVIRKGELQLNVDQTLEEVEEQITEIGSKMYHDQLTRGRSVDMSSLMKGVFGVKKPTRRKRSKRKLKNPAQ